MPQINTQHAALVLIEILYEKGLINKETYDNIQKSQKTAEPKNSQNVA